MIDIGKKITLTFCKMFENVQFLHLKYGRSAIMTPKIIEKYQYGFQKTQNFMLISNSLMPALKNALNKS
jgi:hypothetical protein